MWDHLGGQYKLNINSKTEDIFWMTMTESNICLVEKNNHKNVTKDISDEHFSQKKKEEDIYFLPALRCFNDYYYILINIFMSISWSSLRFQIHAFFFFGNNFVYIKMYSILIGLIWILNYCLLDLIVRLRNFYLKLMNSTKKDTS